LVTRPVVPGSPSRKLLQEIARTGGSRLRTRIYGMSARTTRRGRRLSDGTSAKGRPVHHRAVPDPTAPQRRHGPHGNPRGRVGTQFIAPTAHRTGCSIREPNDRDALHLSPAPTMSPTISIDGRRRSVPMFVARSAKPSTNFLSKVVRDSESGEMVERSKRQNARPQRTQRTGFEFDTS
jgi:hypothetical protein